LGGTIKITNSGAATAGNTVHRFPNSLGCLQHATALHGRGKALSGLERIIEQVEQNLL
jgi:hypothetical protein